MSGKPGGHGRRPRSLAALIAVCCAVLLSSAPGVASAVTGEVTPFVDCYTTNSDGTRTVVLGYTNVAEETITIGHGDKNTIVPSRFQGSQPKHFVPGTQRGAFSLRLTRADLAGDARWELDRTTLDLSAVTSADACSPSTPLPSLGNGTGLAVVLVAGGAFGGFFVRRVIRRAGASGPEAEPAS